MRGLKEHSTALCISHLLLGCVCLGAISCGEASPRVPIDGTVSYQGKPIEEGQIIFFPTDSKASPSTGGVIQDGRYNIPKSKGPYAGVAYRVEITALGAAKSYTPNVSGAGPMVNVREQVIPPQYNQHSTLSVTISPDKPEYDFELE